MTEQEKAIAAFDEEYPPPWHVEDICGDLTVLSNNNNILIHNYNREISDGICAILNNRAAQKRFIEAAEATIEFSESVCVEQQERIAQLDKDKADLVEGLETMIRSFQCTMSREQVAHFAPFGLIASGLIAKHEAKP